MGMAYLGLGAGLRFYLGVGYMTRDGRPASSLDKANFQKAVECFGEAIKIDPNDVAAWDSMSVAYQGLNNLPEAIRCLEEAIKIDPHRTNAVNRLKILRLKIESED